MSTTKGRIEINKLLISLCMITMFLRGLFFVPEVIRIMVWILFIITGVLGIISGSVRLKSSSYNKLIYVYCILLTISGIVGGYFSLNTILSSCQFIFFTLIMVNFKEDDISVGLSKYFKYLKYLIFISIGYSLVLKLFGSIIYYEGKYINYLFSVSIKQYTYGMRDEQLGYSGLYENSNVFAFYVLMVLIIWLNRKNKEKPIKNFFELIWIIIGIVLSNSRGVIVCTVIIVAIYFFAWIKRKTTRKSFAMLVVLTLGVIIVAGTLFWNNAITFIGGIDLAGRAEMWNLMLKSIAEHPIWGTGFSTSTKYLLGDVVTGSTVGSHNSYLNILCENGIVGFVVFISMNIYICVLAYKRRQAIMSDDMAKIAIIIFLIYMPYAFIENAYMIVEGRGYLWLLVCAFLEQYCKRIELVLKDRRI